MVEGCLVVRLVDSARCQLRRSGHLRKHSQGIPHAIDSIALQGEAIEKIDICCRLSASDFQN